MGNSRVHVVIPIGPRLFPLAPFTLYIFFWTNVGLGCNLSTHAFDIQEIVAHVSNRDIALFLLIVTGKFAAYFMLPNLTSIISSFHDNHSESDEEARLLSGLSESLESLISSGTDFVFLDVCGCPIILLTWLLVLCDLHVCLFE